MKMTICGGGEEAMERAGKNKETNRSIPLETIRIITSLNKKPSLDINQNPLTEGIV
jgi:hypothetical protein